MKYRVNSRKRSEKVSVFTNSMFYYFSQDTKTSSHVQKTLTEKKSKLHNFILKSNELEK